MSIRDNRQQPPFPALPVCRQATPHIQICRRASPGLQVLTHDFLFLYLILRGADLPQSLKIINKAPREGAPRSPPNLRSHSSAANTISAHHTPPPLREPCLLRVL